MYAIFSYFSSWTKQLTVIFNFTKHNNMSSSLKIKIFTTLKVANYISVRIKILNMTDHFFDYIHLPWETVLPATSQGLSLNLPTQSSPVTALFQ